jgi:hypothetical protein
MKQSNRLARQRARTIQRRTLTRTRRRNRLVAGRCHPRKCTVANNPGHNPDPAPGFPHPFRGQPGQGRTKGDGAWQPCDEWGGPLL